MNVLKVLAKPGTKCPLENGRDLVPDSGEPVALPATSFNRRLVADGSLIECGTKTVEPASVKEAVVKKTKEAKTDGK
jgi:hypothetical protein